MDTHPSSRIHAAGLIDPAESFNSRDSLLDDLSEQSDDALFYGSSIFFFCWITNTLFDAKNCYCHLPSTFRTGFLFQEKEMTSAVPEENWSHHFQFWCERCSILWNSLFCHLERTDRNKMAHNFENKLLSKNGSNCRQILNRKYFLYLNCDKVFF
ncbi:hypothetical protein CDAR_566381 [Caerostris darwini]|uniref:Uncharacterized protein n=1 Tax=Caerostris darwini TaxID=1538125 RepID=A0AAV4RPQ5_9ARAC|nr:hypothetical protein CDAR_566381 [Caerostris darwini]